MALSPPRLQTYLRGPVGLQLVKVGRTYRERDAGARLNDWAVNWNDLIHPGDIGADGTSALVRSLQSALNAYCAKCAGNASVCARDAGDNLRGRVVENGVFNASTAISLKRLFASTLPRVSADTLANPRGPFANTPAGWRALVDAAWRRVATNKGACP